MRSRSVRKSLRAFDRFAIRINELLKLKGKGIITAYRTEVCDDSSGAQCAAKKGGLPIVKLERND